MKPILIPKSYNYLGVFLTMKCQLGCSYCINNFGTTKVWKELSGEDWIKGLSRIQTREDLPITLQGGEPTIHKDFYRIARGIHLQKKDLLTNGIFDFGKFTTWIHPDSFKRENSPYASIRFSYHKSIDARSLAQKVFELQKLNYSVGIWGLSCNDNSEMRSICYGFGIDYREKEYLDETHGEYKYPDAILKKERKHVKCKPSEMLIAPDGSIYRCHSDLYSGRNQQGHILDKNVELATDFISCDNYGYCNPCDVKLKTNRFQEMGHTSVEIKEEK